MNKVLSAAFATTAFVGALLVGPHAPFSTIPVAQAIDILCSDGTEPTCSPIYSSDGRIIGYSCVC